MKKKNFKTGIALLFGASILMGTVSCKKEYAKYDDKEVLENSYPGTIELEGNTEARGDFEGDGDSGTFSFVWENTSEKATVDFDVSTTEGGSCQIILNDANGDEVFNQTRPEGGSDSFSVVSEEGKEGNWLVTINLVDFKGDGTYDITPKN